MTNKPTMSDREGFMLPHESENQKSIVLEHLQSGKTITRLQALKMYDIMHLPTRIKHLRQDGYPIVTHRRIAVSGRSYAEYELIATQKEEYASQV